MLAANAIAPLPGYGLEFPSTGDRGAPARTAGGGTRGGLCEGGDWTQQSIEALVPANNVSTFSGDRASLWLHIAEGFDRKRAEIYVQDPQTRTVVHEEQMVLRGLDEGGIIKIDLPATDSSGAPLLESNRNYFWEFAIICNPNDRTQDYLVQGWMSPMALNAELTEALAGASPVEQAALYAEAGIWQETLSIAEALKPSQPELWTDLLTSVGLETLAANPLTDCCSLAAQ